MKTMCILAICRVSTWKKNIRVWSAFILGAGLCVLPVSRYLAFAEAIGEPIQIFESYIVIGNSASYLTALLLGGVLLLSDTPFISNRTTYEILRTGKKNWLLGQVAYTAISSLVYMAFMMIVCVIITLLRARSYIEDQWSDAILLLACQTPDFAVATFRLSFECPIFVESTTPSSAAMLTLLFHSMYLCILCLLMMAVNVVTHTVLGWILAGMVHIVGYVIYANGTQVFSQRLSLLSCAIPAYQFTKSYNITTLYSVLLFSFIMIILTMIIKNSSCVFEPKG